MCSREPVDLTTLISYGSNVFIVFGLGGSLSGDSQLAVSNDADTQPPPVTTFATVSSEFIDGDQRSAPSSAARPFSKTRETAVAVTAMLPHAPPALSTNGRPDAETTALPGPFIGCCFAAAFQRQLADDMVHPVHNQAASVLLRHASPRAIFMVDSGGSGGREGPESNWALGPERPWRAHFISPSGPQLQPRQDAVDASAPGLGNYLPRYLATYPWRRPERGLAYPQRLLDILVEGPRSMNPALDQQPWHLVSGAARWCKPLDQHHLTKAWTCWMDGCTLQEQPPPVTSALVVDTTKTSQEVVLGSIIANTNSTHHDGHRGPSWPQMPAWPAFVRSMQPSACLPVVGLCSFIPWHG
ncbi:hypothetical protein G7046_g6124 [Stylonectria norvegica]|nr:hypothetical protein G7046_g6124 [Stylonectria norvegica]